MAESVRSLKVIIMAYHRLDVQKLGSVSGIIVDPRHIDKVISWCVFFVRLRDNKIRFVHHFHRDCLVGQAGRALLDHHDRYEHGEMGMKSLVCLHEKFRADILDIRQPDASRETNERATLVGHSQEICELSFSLDGRQIASASSTIKWRNMSTVEVEKTLSGHTASVNTTKIFAQ
jgi:WD40 repeat protein